MQTSVTLEHFWKWTKSDLAGEVLFNSCFYNRTSTSPVCPVRQKLSQTGFKPFNPHGLSSNSPYYLPYNSYDFSLEGLLLDQLTIPLLIFSLFSSLDC